METIYINRPTIQAKKETIYKRKLIIHDGKHVLVYKSRRNYRFIGSQGDEDLVQIANLLTGFEIKESDIEPLVRIIDSYVRYDHHNNKLIPIIREKIKDYYTYYHELDDETIKDISNPNHPWFKEPLVLSEFKVLASKDEAFNKVRKPIEYLWKKER